MKKILIFAVIVAVLFVSQASFAFDIDGPIRKLSRGGANILTCIIELPKNIGEVNYEDGPIAALTYGLAKGLYRTGLRGVVGIYELVTAPIPFPANYAPIINDPEFFLPDGLF